MATVDEGTRQLQWGQLHLALQIARGSAAEFVEGVEAVDEHDAEWDQVIHWMTTISGYTLGQLNVFASKAEDLNLEVAAAERAAGWDPTP